MNDSRPSLARNAFYLVLGQVGSTALAIFFSAALGRGLGAKDFGLYFLVNTMTTFAFVVVDWGQNFWVIREVAKAPDRAGDLLGTSLTLRAAGALAVALPVGATSWALGYDPRTCWTSMLFVVCSAPFFVAQGFGMAFRARDRMGLDASVTVANKAVALGAVLLVFWLGAKIAGVLAALAVAGLAAVALAWVLLPRVLTTPLRFSRQTARDLLVGGTAIVAMHLSISVQPYLDAVILSKLAPADAMGWFGAARNVMGTLFAPAAILGAAAYPRFSRIAQDHVAMAHEVRVALRPLLFLGALAFVGTYLFAGLAIGLIYGQKGFGPATIILQAFSPGLFLIFIDVLFGHALTAMGLATPFAAFKIGSVVVSTVLDLLLVPWFQAKYGNGGIGVVVAFGASEVVVFGGALMLLPRGTLGWPVLADSARALAAAAATWLLFLLLPAFNPWLGLPVCVLAFTAAAFALGLVRQSDLQFLRAALRR